MSLPFQVERFRGVVFDCDGVVLDSNGIKARAFEDILANQPQTLLERFRAYRSAHPGFTRTTLFQHYFRDLARMPDWDARADDASRLFAERTVEELTACSLVPGVERALATLNEAGLPCVIVSAGAQADLETIMARRGLRQRFAAIRGGERTKAEHIEALLAGGVIRRPLAYFGDSRADQDAAETTACEFIFVAGSSEWTTGPGPHVPTIMDFHDLAMIPGPKRTTVAEA